MFKVILENKQQFVPTGDGSLGGKSKAYDDARFAGAMCYQPSIRAAMDNRFGLNVENTLFKPGHHTTMQHASHYMSFALDDIPVSLATFGLHMTHPFYNSSQRSGRYCLDIFD